MGGISACPTGLLLPARLVAAVSRHWSLLALLVLATALRTLFFIGILGSDDTAYAFNAIAIRNGSFVLADDMTSMRLALNAAAAASFGLLGVSEWAMALPAFLSSLLTLAVVYAIAMLLAGRCAAISAGLLYTLAPLNILNSSSLLPEVPMAFLTALSVLLFLLGQRAASLPVVVLLYLMSGVVLGIAYLFKEPAALLAPAFVAAAGLAWYRGDRHAGLCLLPVAGFAVVFLLETLVYLHTSGVWLRRFRGIAEYQAAAVLRSEQERRLQSIWLYPRNMFLVLNQVGLLFYMLLGGAVVAVRRRRGVPIVVLLWVLLPFLYLEFGSTSLASYNPLPKQPRYLEAMTAPIVILLGYWLARAWRSPKAFARRAAWACLALFVLTSPFFTAISVVDRRAATQPIRDSAAFLDGAGLRPVYATSIIANGLSIHLADLSHTYVGRACFGCVTGPCTRQTVSTAGEVWAAPRGLDPGTLPSPAVCDRWRASSEIPLVLPPLHHRFIKAVLIGVDYLPTPSVVRSELRPLRLLLEPRHVVLNLPSEDR